MPDSLGTILEATAMITVTSLKPRHNLDNELVVITGLFLTTDHALMVTGHCSLCLKDVTILIPLTELRDACPGPMDYGVEDLSFLHDLHIALPETCQNPQ